MTGKLALPHVFDSVKALMEADAAALQPPIAAVPHLWGRREHDTKMTVGPRFVWIPGDPNGRLGPINPPRAPGRNPRSLGTLEELCTLEVLCDDPVKPMDERAQYEVTRALFDAWFRAIYTVAHGAFRIVDTSWIAPDRKIARRGDAIRVIFAVQAVLADEPLEIAPADTAAHVTTAELDHAEDFTTGKPVTVDGELVRDDDGDIVEDA